MKDTLPPTPTDFVVICVRTGRSAKTSVGALDTATRHERDRTAPVRNDAILVF